MDGLRVEIVPLLGELVPLGAGLDMQLDLVKNVNLFSKIDREKAVLDKCVGVYERIDCFVEDLQVHSVVAYIRQRCRAL